MKPTDVLKAEHRVIEVMLDCLDAICAEAETNGRLDRQAATDAIDFIKMFADTCHHGKEEGQLFPAMTEKGLPVQGSPIGVMLHEHEIGRAYVAGMLAQVDKAAEGGADAVAQFVDQARGYVLLLRNHIFKEDNILFPMADRIMNGDDQQHLMQRFDHVETDHMGAGTHTKYLKLAVDLATRYRIPHNIDTHASGGSCGCGHAKKAANA